MSMGALLIEVEPTDPPSLSVVVLTQRVEVGPPDWDLPVRVLVGIWPDGRIEALRGCPSWSPVAPAPLVGFSPVAEVLLERGQVAVSRRSITLLP